MTSHLPLPFTLCAHLYLQLAQMEESGIASDRAFAILDLPAPATQRLIAMRAFMKRQTFASAGERSGLFSTLEARLIQASMTAGSPARIYRRLADFYTTRAMQVATVRARLMMPAAVLLMALCVQPLPGLVSGATSIFGYLLHVTQPLLVIALLWFGLRWWLTKPGAASGLLSMPLIGGLVRRQNTRDFFESLALMLEAGVAMLDALPLALETVREPSIRRDFARIAPRVANGATLAQALAEGIALGDAASRERVITFVTTGEASGTLPEMLMRHAAMETASINDWYQQLATWAPRIVYGLVMVWMVVSLLGSSAPRVPVDL